MRLVAVRLQDCGGPLRESYMRGVRRAEPDWRTATAMLALFDLGMMMMTTTLELSLLFAIHLTHLA
eukprot:535813-Rhodomonas_salina.2